MGVRTLRGHLDFRGEPRPRARGLPHFSEVFAQGLKRYRLTDVARPDPIFSFSLDLTPYFRQALKGRDMRHRSPSAVRTDEAHT